ncbi:hypothetical protein GCM10029992_60060 [Glycomyces albus]
MPRGFGTPVPEPRGLFGAIDRLCLLHQLRRCMRAVSQFCKKEKAVLSALLPVVVISATVVALFGIVLPLLLLGPLMASRSRPQPQQLLFAVVLLIPTVAIGAVFLSWWSVSWLESTEAPSPALVGISLVAASTVGLLAPLRLPGQTGPFWLKPLLGFSSGVLVPVAVMESIVIGLHPVAGAAIGVVVLGVLIAVFRIVGRPLAARKQAKQVRGAVERFEGQLVDLTDEAWRLAGARGDANRIVMRYNGEVEGKKLGAELLLARDMDWCRSPGRTRRRCSSWRGAWAGSRPRRCWRRRSWALRRR